MSSDESQKKVFDFFLDRYDSRETFTQEEVEAIANWQGKTFSTYLSKQFRSFVIPNGDGKFRISEAFGRYATWEKFQSHVTQVRGSVVDYKKRVFDIVQIYEFFMPLTNENYLRAALDTLFYKDTIIARLKTIDPVEQNKCFPKKDNENAEAYTERLCNWLSNKFGGYSIYHVSGRFRAGDLMSRTDAGNLKSRYLVDETTAVTRFIFPCESKEEADQISFFFTNLFIKAITEVVNGEDEIWMVESGLNNRLHIWRVNKNEK